MSQNLKGKTTVQTFSAGGVITNDYGEILLIDEGDGFWGFPKGRIENGEDALAAALREVKEETGLSNITLVNTLGSYQRYPIISGVEDQSELKNITLFLFHTNHAVLPPNQENNTCIWFSFKDAAQKLSHAKDKEFFIRAMDQSTTSAK